MGSRLSKHAVYAPDNYKTMMQSNRSLHQLSQSAMVTTKPQREQVPNGMEFEVAKPEKPSSLPRKLPPLPISAETASTKLRKLPVSTNAADVTVLSEGRPQRQMSPKKAVGNPRKLPVPKLFEQAAPAQPLKTSRKHATSQKVADLSYVPRKLPVLPDITTGTPRKLPVPPVITPKTQKQTEDPLPIKAVNGRTKPRKLPPLPATNLNDVSDSVAKKPKQNPTPAKSMEEVPAKPPRLPKPPKATVKPKRLSDKQDSVPIKSIDDAPAEPRPLPKPPKTVKPKRLSDMQDSVPTKSIDDAPAEPRPLPKPPKTTAKPERISVKHDLIPSETIDKAPAGPRPLPKPPKTTPIPERSSDNHNLVPTKPIDEAIAEPRPLPYSPKTTGKPERPSIKHDLVPSIPINEAPAEQRPLPKPPAKSRSETLSDKQDSVPMGEVPAKPRKLPKPPKTTKPEKLSDKKESVPTNAMSEVTTAKPNKLPKPAKTKTRRAKHSDNQELPTEAIGEAPAKPRPLPRPPVTNHHGIRKSAVRRLRSSRQVNNFDPNVQVHANPLDKERCALCSKLKYGLEAYRTNALNLAKMFAATSSNKRRHNGLLPTWTNNGLLG